MSNICIIGAGWYGCHLALTLKKAGHNITLFEKNTTIFSGISGKYGIRLHAGPHYPRSEETRKSCQRGFLKFQQQYQELVIPHESTIYALGNIDADGNPSKIDLETFRNVCNELGHCHEIDLTSNGYQNLISAMEIEEPSIAVGKRLRDLFTSYLKEAAILVVCQVKIEQVRPEKNKVIVEYAGSSQAFDHVINATSYQAFLPKDPKNPFDIETIYQPCLSLIYQDTTPNERPFSFIVLDGWYPSLMPSIDSEGENERRTRKYILTHAKWTIMGSYPNAEEARNNLNLLNDELVSNTIREYTEHEMNRFWPEFSKRFVFLGWQGEVLAKIRTKSEFRSAITYEKDRVIHIIPGKISNIFDVENEVHAILKNEDLIEKQGYRYTKNGVLAASINEITDKPNATEPNTSNIKTYTEISQSFFPPTPKSTTKNHYFELQCLAGILAGLAILATVILYLSVLGTIATAIVGSAAITGIGYCTYNLFSERKKRAAGNVKVDENPTLTLDGAKNHV